MKVRRRGGDQGDCPRLSTGGEKYLYYVKEAERIMAHSGYLHKELHRRHVWFERRDKKWKWDQIDLGLVEKVEEEEQGETEKEMDQTQDL